MRLVLTGVLAANLLGSGCATDAEMKAVEPRESQSYSTGSNMPKRDRISNVKTVDKDDFDKQGPPPISAPTARPGAGP